MNELSVFNNPDFGEVRTLDHEGVIMFCGTDVARSLLYGNPQDAIRRHCREDGCEIHAVIDTMGRTQQTKFITEGNVFRLIVKASSQSVSEDVREKADKFERWIFDEVLPQIRRSGSYGHHERSLETKESIRIIKELKPLARLRPQYYIDAVQQVLKQTGIPVTPTVHQDHVPHTSVVYESPIDEFIASYGSIVGQPSGEIYSAYKEYCLKRNAPVESHIEFSKQVKLNHGLKTGFKKIKGKTCRVYVLE